MFGQDYPATVQRKKQARSLGQNVIRDGPRSIEGRLIWRPDQITEYDYVYCLTPADLSVVEEALRHFQGTLSPMLVLLTSG